MVRQLDNKLKNKIFNFTDKLDFFSLFFYFFILLFYIIVNSLSPSDATFYQQSKLVSHIKSLMLRKEIQIHNLGVRLHNKFLVTKVLTTTTQNKKNKIIKETKKTTEIDYRPVKILLNSNFIDVLARKKKNDKNNLVEQIWHTVPTAVQEDYMHVQKMRLDAVLLKSTDNSVTVSKYKKRNGERASRIWKAL